MFNKQKNPSDSSTKKLKLSHLNKGNTICNKDMEHRKGSRKLLLITGFTIILSLAKMHFMKREGFSFEALSSTYVYSLCNTNGNVCQRNGMLL